MLVQLGSVTASKRLPLRLLIVDPVVRLHNRRKQARRVVLARLEILDAADQAVKGAALLRGSLGGARETFMLEVVAQILIKKGRLPGVAWLLNVKDADFPSMEAREVEGSWIKSFKIILYAALIQGR